MRRFLLAASSPVALPALLALGLLGGALFSGCSGSSDTNDDAMSGGATAWGGGLGSGGSASGGTPGSGGMAPAGGGTASGGSDANYPPFESCSTPSVDRLQKWWGTAEGPTVPGDGQSLLVAEGDTYVAKVEFASAPSWHVAPIWIANEFAGVDVSSATELRIEYSATSDLWVQLRPEATYSGGEKWHHLLPATAGEFSVLTIPLDAASWVTKFGQPPGSVADALTDLCGLVLVGNTNNLVVVRSLRIAGYTPACL